MEEKNIDLLSIFRIIGNLDSTKKYDIKIEEHSEKRSLDANGYYWYLVNQLANVLRISKEELHLRMLKDYGQVDTITVLERVPIQNYGIKYYELYKTTEKNGNKFNVYKVYQESHTMNRKQFSILLDGIIQECQQQGIQTGTRDQIDALLRAMDG